MGTPLLWVGLAALVPAASAFVATNPLLPRASVATVAAPFAEVALAPMYTNAAARLHGATVAWAGGLSSMKGHHDDLMLALVSPEAFWLLRNWQLSAFGDQFELRRSLDSVRSQIRAMGARDAQSPIRGSTVSVRCKGLWSTFAKANVLGKSVHDVLAVRVVVKGGDEADVYAALDAIREVWPSVPGRFKDYVRAPKANGYRSLHDTLRLPCGSAFEVQVRTEEMHGEAEWGEASHRRYKGVVAQLSERLLSGIRDGRVSSARWPVNAQTALTLATKLAENN